MVYSIHILARADGDIVALEILERNYRATATLPRSLLDAMADALLRSLEKLVSEGLLKTYQPMTFAGSFLKGRIDFSSSIRGFWSKGSKHKAVSSSYQLLANTPQNRLLRFACYSLLRNYSAMAVEGRTISALQHFEELLSAVGVSLERPDAVILTGGLSPSYIQALSLATAIIAKKGIELPGAGTDLTLPSFLVDMETVFEKYIRNTLIQGLPGSRVRDGNLYGKALFDDRKQPSANPDITISSVAGFHLVGDVKYKLHFSRNDVNQVLTYALSFRVNLIVLFLPIQNAPATSLTLIGELQAVKLYRYEYNLAAEDLAEEERSMCATIQQLLDENPPKTEVENAA